MNLDYEIFSKINSLAGHIPTLDLVMAAVAKWGVLVYGIVLISLWFKKAHPEQMMNSRKGVLKVIFTAAIALGINQIIGLAYFRPRPFATNNVTLLLDRSTDPSFPSDHATGATAFTASIFGENKAWGTILTVMSLVLFFSRVYCGTHYPLDILGGMVTGLIGSYIANKLWPYLDGIAGKLVMIWNRLVDKSTGV